MFFSPKTATLVLIWILPVLTLFAKTTLYITADIQGSLIGNECICGDNTAGLPAPGYLLEQRDKQSTFYIDAGGLPYPNLDSPILNEYLDRALNLLGVDLIISNNKKPGFYRNGFILRKAGKIVLVAVGKEFKLIKNKHADLKILIHRGNLNKLDSPYDYIDLIILTGPESPGNDSLHGGVKGIDVNGVPWMSLAPGGNGLGVIRFSSDTPLEIDIIRLEYGVSTESSAIVELGEQYLTEIAEEVTE